MVSHSETGSDSPIGSDRDRGRDSMSRPVSRPSKLSQPVSRPISFVETRKLCRHQKC